MVIKVTDLDEPTEITRSDIDDVTNVLLSADAWTISEGIEAEDKFGTGPVKDSYFAMCHTDLSSDLEAVNGFLNKAQYPDRNRTLNSEWGTAGNLRFFVSSRGSTQEAGSTENRKVYNVFCMGRQAYGCIKQDQYSAQFIYRAPILNGHLAQNASVGYKFAQAARILNDDWIYKLRTTRST